MAAMSTTLYPMFSFQTQLQDDEPSLLGLDENDPSPLLLSQTFFTDQELLLPLDHHDEYSYYHHELYPKRQKTHHHHHQFHYPSFIEYFFPNPTMLPEFEPLPSPEIHIPQQPAAAPIRNTNHAAATMVNKGSDSGGVSLSPQSIAARERRRRIADKTNELGKLVPSGSRMNSTAEMLQAAYKYISFLKAQVAMLKLMDSDSQDSSLIQVVASPIVQEKLYSEEKCLVSREFVENLAKNQDIQSMPLLKDRTALLSCSEINLITRVDSDSLAS